MTTITATRPFVVTEKELVVLRGPAVNRRSMRADGRTVKSEIAEEVNAGAVGRKLRT